MNSNKVDYKRKYLDLRSKFVSSLDVAYRLGYDQATKDATVQQAQMQMQQAQMQMQQAAQQQGMMSQLAGGAGQEGGQPMPEEAQGQEGQQPSGDEIDDYIAQIEELVNKTENVPEDLKKAIEGIKVVKTKPNFSLSYKHNLPEHQKKVLTKQEEIVESLMKKWDEEAKSTANDIIRTVKSI
jgi:hypothetical protein